LNPERIEQLNINFSGDMFIQISGRKTFLKTRSPVSGTCYPDGDSVLIFFGLIWLK